MYICKLSRLLLVREVHKALLTEKQEKATQEWKRRKVEKEQDGSRLTLTRTQSDSLTHFASLYLMQTWQLLLVLALAPSRLHGKLLGGVFARNFFAGASPTQTSP